MREESTLRGCCVPNLAPGSPELAPDKRGKVYTSAIFPQRNEDREEKAKIAGMVLFVCQEGENNSSVSRLGCWDTVVAFLKTSSIASSLERYPQEKG